MNEYKPTKEELAIINERFAKVSFKSENDLYVFPAMVIDNQLTAYYTRVHPTFLEQCVKDLINGVGFLVGHDRTKLPMARSFKGQMTSNDNLQEVYGKFFMQKNLEINEINTDDFMKAFLGGTIEDVSIGFAAKRYECNLCGNDIRSADCPHWPGKKYNEDDKEDGKGTLCFAWVMEPAGPSGEALLEVSAVYKGAAPKAKQKKASEAPKFVINLSEGKNLKEMPIEEAISINFSFPFSEEYERGRGRGRGGPRQGDGGAKYCKCPKCGYTIEHERGKPCQEISCPKCGTKMEGSDTKGGERNMFDIEKFFSSKYTQEELKDLEIDVDKILAQEASEEEVKTLKEKFSAEELGNLLKEYPAYELLQDELARWTRAYINSLPNASFAVIEPAYTRGETENKNARHLPHHNERGGGTSNENLDLPHLRNAMARMNQIKPVTDSISTEELRSKASSHLENHRSALEGRREQDFVELEEKLKTSEANNKVLLDENKKVTSEVNQLKTEIETLKQANIQLQKEVDELKPKVKDGEKYREDLISETLELGIKLNGNSFDKANYEKILKEPARTIEDIKKMRDQFLKELCEKFPGSRQTTSPQLGLPKDNSQGVSIPDEAFKSE